MLNGLKRPERKTKETDDKSQSKMVKKMMSIIMLDTDELNDPINRKHFQCFLKAVYIVNKRT